MIKLTHYSPSFKGKIEKYVLTDTTFTRHPLTAVMDIKEDDGKSLLMGTENNEILFFMILDEGEDKKEYTDDKNSILFRTFSVDERFQGKGLGRLALRMMKKYVEKEKPYTSEIFLLAEKENKKAVNLYLSEGFRIREGSYEGDKGPQYLMYLKMERNI